MKKVKVKLSEAKKKVGKTNWVSLKGTDSQKSNDKTQPTKKTRG